MDRATQMNEPGDLAQEPRERLPLLDTGTGPDATMRARPRRLRRVLLLLALPMLAFVAGGVIGLYYQPPGLRFVFALTGLEPGGGVAAPIAVAPAAEAAPARTAAIAAADIVALGRIVPEGDVITLAPPFGAGDARIAEILVAEGAEVAAGDVVAVLDNLPPLEAALDSARAVVALREAALAQTRASVAASLRESRAEVARAEAALGLARADLDRTRDLAGRGVGTAAALDRAEAAAAEAGRTLDRARAVLSRYEGAEDGLQPDVRLAERELDAARADAVRAARDLDKARVVTPSAGTILSLNARIGERPGAGGLATLADIARMTVVLEVYQTDIRRVALGRAVRIRAEALGEDVLTGSVGRIGLEVGRQTLVASDPAANTDARVVEVTVVLDAPSSELAARLTGLEVTGVIEIGDDG